MSNEREGREKAAWFRTKHELGVGPIDDVFVVAELVGVDVVCIDAGDQEHGLTARDERNGATVFVVNNSLPAARFRSTLAHELAHLLFDEDLTKSVTHEYSGDSETRAHAFARHLLLPLDAVNKARKDMPNLDNDQLLNWYVRRYGVSPKIAAYQMNNAKLIDQDTCTRFARLHTGNLAWTNGWADLSQERDAVVRRERRPLLLQGKATRAYLQGKLSAQELAALTGTTLQEIQAHLQPENGATKSPDYIDFGDDNLPDAL